MAIKKARGEAFLRGAGKAAALPEMPFTDLSKLSNEELLLRVEQVEDQAVLNKWRCLYELRTRFASDKLFGQYLESLKDDPTISFKYGGRTDLWRAISAGRFCAKHNISSLSAVGLTISSVYVLSRKSSEAVADQVYKQIKHKHPSFREVEIFVSQHPAIPSEAEEIEEIPPVSEAVGYERRSVMTIPVVANVAQIPEVLQSVGPYNPVKLALTYIPEPVQETSIEQIAADVMQFVEKYGLSMFKLIPVFKQCIAIAQGASYPKPNLSTGEI